MRETTYQIALWTQARFSLLLNIAGLKRKTGQLAMAIAFAKKR